MFSSFNPKNLMFFILLLVIASSSVHAYPIRDAYILRAGPITVSGEDGGSGAVVGLVQSPQYPFGLWTSAFVGGYGRKNLVLQGDLIAAYGLGEVNVFLGIGMRGSKSKASSGQITYGLLVGPTSMALRRYDGPKGSVTEGVIALTVPFFGFGRHY